MRWDVQIVFWFAPLFVCSHSVHQEARTAGQPEQSFQSFPENYKSEGVGSLVNATAIHPRILQTTQGWNNFR